MTLFLQTAPAAVLSEETLFVAVIAGGVVLLAAAVFWLIRKFTGKDK